MFLTYEGIIHFSTPFSEYNLAINRPQFSFRSLVKQQAVNSSGYEASALVCALLGTLGCSIPLCVIQEWIDRAVRQSVFEITRSELTNQLKLSDPSLGLFMHSVYQRSSSVDEQKNGAPSVNVGLEDSVTRDEEPAVTIKTAIGVLSLGEDNTKREPALESSSDVKHGSDAIDRPLSPVSEAWKAEKRERRRLFLEAEKQSAQEDIDFVARLQALGDKTTCMKGMNSRFLSDFGINSFDGSEAEFLTIKPYYGKELKLKGKTWYTDHDEELPSGLGAMLVNSLLRYRRLADDETPLFPSMVWHNFCKANDVKSHEIWHDGELFTLRIYATGRKIRECAHVITSAPTKKMARQIAHQVLLSDIRTSCVDPNGR
jgi:hypothetical protein